MAVPRNRHSNARKLSKRAHHAKRPRSLSICRFCKKAKLPHCVCPSCKTYKEATAPILAEESTPAT